MIKTLPKIKAMYFRNQNSRVYGVVQTYTSSLHTQARDTKGAQFRHTKIQLGKK